MKIDKLTQVLLALITLGLFLNGLNPWLRPAPVAAQSHTEYLHTTGVEQDIHRIMSAVDGLSSGRCANKKICRGY